jgi:Zn-dependent protease with chaperone function
VFRRALAGLFAAALAAAQQRELKPGFNLFSVEQDIQMGREYAAQVEQQMPVIKDEALNAFVQRMGGRLAKTREAGKFPYTFKVVHNKSINAFALPGGPTFTNTGLISSADNEAQIAGVLAHEISHVALRHGTNQASKANLIQIPAMLGGAMAGGGLMGTLAQLGIGLGANSVLLKFSRSAERDADLLGARIMHAAGYNPIEMARFFEKLEAEAGKSNAITEFLSSHPNPGNRVKAVQEEIRYLSRKEYSKDSGELPQMKKIITGLGEPPQRAAPGQSAPQGDPNPAVSRPSSKLTRLSGNGVSFDRPENWEVFKDSQSGSATIAPRTGLFQSKEGVSIGYGMIVSFHRSGKERIRDRAQELVDSLAKSNPGMKIVEGPVRSNPAGNSGYLYRLSSPSPYPGNETDLVLALERPGGVFYIVFVAPDSDYASAWPVFEKIISSVRFEN